MANLPRPITGLMSQTGRQHMRKDSRSGRHGAFSRTGQAVFKSCSEPSLGRCPGGGRPSTSARRENSRKEVFNEQLMQQTTCSQVAEVSDHRRDSLETLSDSFGKDIRGVTDRLEDIVRGLRFENFKGKQEKEERKRREEERKWEEEKRRARKKEQDAADPKKKVALRIENRRKFDSGSNSPNSAATIPMCPVQVEGPLGPEIVSLVDVEGLRSRCLQMNGKTSIDALMDALRSREKAERSASALADAVSPRSTGGKSTFSIVSGGTSSGTCRTWEQRQHSALAKRQAARLESILRKLCSMRSGLPRDLQIDIAPLQAYLDYERSHSERSDLESLQAVVAQKLNGFIDNLANKLAAAPDSANSALFQSLGKLSQAAIGEQLNMSQRLLGTSNNSLASTLVDEEALRSAKRKRTRRRLVIMQAVGRWIMVGRRVRWRSYNIDIIKVTLGQLGEWARVKSAMKKAVASVRHIQQNARRFLAVKRERCKQIAQEWDRVEDHSLERFYDRFAVKLFKDNFSQAERPARSKGRRGAFKDMMSAVKGVAFNWRAFKVPAAVRARLISAFYMIRLRTKVRSTSDLLKTVKMVLAKHRELNGFLSFFGSSMSGEESFSRPKTNASWWIMPESTVLYLMGLAAQSLQARQVSPFEDHPCHKDLPGNFMFLKPQMDYNAVLAEGATSMDQAVMRLMQRCCLERMYKQDNQEGNSGGPKLQRKATRVSMSSSADSSEQTQSERPKGPADLEDIFAAFTPRLREIHEEQLLEHPGLRPGIRPQICMDLYILRIAATWAQRWFHLNTDLPALVDEYGGRLVDELDFRAEAVRAEAFRGFAEKRLEEVTAAKPVLELSTTCVLVTEWVDGERLEVTAARDLEEAKRLQGLGMTSYLAWASEGDWQQTEISSLVQEAQTLRRQKVRLEEQIAQAEDANASFQSSWEALSRASTTFVNSRTQDDTYLERHQEAPEKDAGEALRASRASLELDLQDLRQRLQGAEVAAGVSCEELAKQTRQKEQQAQELALLLQELQGFQQQLAAKGRLVAEADRKQAEDNEAMSTLAADQAALQEENAELQSELREALEALPSAARQQREKAAQVRRSQQQLSEAEENWQAQVRAVQSAVLAEERHLAKLLARRESANLASMETQRVRSDLASALANARLEHGRLQALRAVPRERCSFEPALAAPAAPASDRLDEVRRLEAEVQAALKLKKCQEGSRRDRSKACDMELRAIEECGSQLHTLSEEMHQRAQALEEELQRESDSLRRLRELALEAMASTKPLRRGKSAPVLAQAPCSWKDVLEKHGDPPEKVIRRKSSEKRSEEARRLWRRYSLTRSQCK
ncbi:unnamed protein product [Effrenium voratum]|nr:unnamed protein product [Effrenium voratum]